MKTFPALLSFVWQSGKHASNQTGKGARLQEIREATKHAGKQAGKQTSKQASTAARRTMARRDKTREENPTNPDPKLKEGHDLANAVALLVGRFTNPNSNKTVIAVSMSK